MNLNRQILESASRNLLKLTHVINDAKQADHQRLRAEYDRLVEGLAQTGIRCVGITNFKFMHPQVALQLITFGRTLFCPMTWCEK